MSYSPAEKETIIRSDDEDKSFTIYTLQGSIITKLKKIGEEPVKVDSDGAHHYKLDWHQVSFRKREKRQMTEEQKRAAGDRMRKMHKKKESND